MKLWLDAQLSPGISLWLLKSFGIEDASQFHCAAEYIRYRLNLQHAIHQWRRTILSWDVSQYACPALSCRGAL
jgi:hypothetical protein